MTSLTTSFACWDECSFSSLLSDVFTDHGEQNISSKGPSAVSLVTALNHWKLVRPDGKTVLGAGRKHVSIGVLLCSSTPGLENGCSVKPK